MGWQADAFKCYDTEWPGVKCQDAGQYSPLLLSLAKTSHYCKATRDATISVVKQDSPDQIVLETCADQPHLWLCFLFACP